MRRGFPFAARPSRHGRSLTASGPRPRSETVSGPVVRKVWGRRERRRPTARAGCRASRSAASSRAAAPQRSGAERERGAAVALELADVFRASEVPRPCATTQPRSTISSPATHGGVTEHQQLPRQGGEPPARCSVNPGPGRRHTVRTSAPTTASAIADASCGSDTREGSDNGARLQTAARVRSGSGSGSNSEATSNQHQ